MTLQQLTYFLAAVEHGSFSAAAEALTEAGRLFRPHAERTVASAEEAAESVREVRDITGGTVTFCTFGSAHHYLLVGLLQDFRTQYPNVRVRAIGQNSAEVADGVRDGHVEAGLVALPVDDRGLDVRSAMREELLYVTADPERLRGPMTVERIAAGPLILYDTRWAAEDPMRRQLRERAQGAGVTLEPQIEVEFVTAALELAARGLGDTISSRQMIRARGLARRLRGVAFDPPLYDTFAFITR